MSDLLGRLIGRAQGVVSAVEPILASRYESAAEFGASPAQRESPEPGFSSDARERREHPDEPKEPKQPEQPAGETQARVGMPREAALNFDVRAEASGPLGSAPPHRQAAESDSVEHAPDPIREQLSPQRAVHSPGERGSGLAARIEKAEAGATASTIEELPVMVTRAEERVPEQPGYALSGPRYQDAARQSKALPVPVAPIEVQVTIGHIEVRAAAAAQAPPPRAARPRAGVSLDDYLKRRNGTVQ